MKKTLIIALAGMMMFAFTQCGGNSENKTSEKKAEKTTVKGTQQFMDMQEAYNEVEKMIKDINTCEELEEVALAVALSGAATSLGNSKYTPEERVTKDEEEKLGEILKDLSDQIEKKAEKLGCEKKTYSL